MDEKSAVEQVLAAYEKLIGADKRIKALEKKLADGTITLREGAELNDLRARAFGKAFSDKVLDIAQGEREGTCTALLREGCNDVDELAQAAQRAVLARQGLNLTPPTAPFEEERARKIGHSLEDTTVPDETIERRARSATENVLKSQYDRNMKKGAETCSAAGLKTYIIRDSGSGCCKWCDEVSGKFVYGTEPKDVYRRHDNCTCTVVYESSRGRQNVWSKQYWSQEQEQEYLRLRDELKAKKMTAAPDVKKPVRLSEKDVQAIINKVGGLTFGENGGRIDNKEPLSTFLNSSEQLYENAKKIKPLPGYQDIVIHGDKTGFSYKDKDGNETNLNVGEFTKILKESGLYKGGKIRLISCEAAAEGANTAQWFANDMGAEVLAPTDIVWVDREGNMTIGPDEFTNTGSWVTVTPEEGS